MDPLKLEPRILGSVVISWHTGPDVIKAEDQTDAQIRDLQCEKLWLRHIDIKNMKLVPEMGILKF